MKPIHSMTGFGSAEGTIGGVRYRVEMKALNHRFLDLKLRLPRELQSAEIPLRKSLEGLFNRGALEIKLERASDAGGLEDAPALNMTLAAHYYEALVSLQKTLGLSDPIRTAEIASLPDVISRTEVLAPPDDAWTELEPLIRAAAEHLSKMRATEGAALTRALTQALDDLSVTITGIRARRTEWQALSKKKIQERIQAVFDAHPLPAGAPAQAVLESRIAQELSILLDRSDIEEELTRFEGHLAHFRKILVEGGPVGRKLDFMLQELGREVNTLSNKAQDLGISEQAVQIKVRIEQIREQVMNLE